MKLSKEFIAKFREEAKRAQWEINRWNGKSIDDLVVDYLERKELKPEDIQGCIVLTVEEAKEFLISFQDLIELHEDGYIKVTDFGFDVFDLVKKRIEQAEGK